MTKWIARPEDHKTHANSWADAFAMAIAELPKHPNKRGILELGFEEYADPSPFFVDFDRVVDVVGKGGGRRCAASRVRASMRFSPAANNSRVRELGLWDGPGDSIYAECTVDVRDVHAAGGNGRGLVINGQYPRNANSSRVLNSVFEEHPTGGIYAYGGDAGHIQVMGCSVLGLSGQAIGVEYAGAATITVQDTLCEWAAAPNSRGFRLDSNASTAVAINLHDESGGLPAQVNGQVWGGNYQRGIEPVPGRPPPLLMLRSGRVGGFTMPMANGAALQFGGDSYFKFYPPEQVGGQPIEGHPWAFAYERRYEYQAGGVEIVHDELALSSAPDWTHSLRLPFTGPSKVPSFPKGLFSEGTKIP